MVTACTKALRNHHSDATYIYTEDNFIYVLEVKKVIGFEEVQKNGE